MKISELMSEDLVLPELKSTDVSGVLKEFSETICNSGRFHSSDTLYARLHEREKQESTGIGNGIAIPHCKVENLNQVLVAVGYSPNGVDFGAIDGKKTSFFFVIISPSGSSVLHLRALAAVSRLLKSPGFVARLQQRPSPADLISQIKKEEEGTT
jgi:PTS system nitrogen regulatory IIA component